ncbi:transglycosylase family protein [Mycobacterium bourgelatii]|nr:transglycosylase family protein [Mycobacterium bourgelatii]
MSGMTHIAKPLIKIATAAGFVAAGLTLSTGVSHAHGGMNWEAVAQCESGGNWQANTGNGHYGGLQFKQSTWEAHGGVGNPAHASKQQQIAVANRVLATQGPGAWPKCGKAGGLAPTAGQPQKPLVQLEQAVVGIINLFTPKQ